MWSYAVAEFQSCLQNSLKIFAGNQLSAEVNLLEYCNSWKNSIMFATVWMQSLHQIRTVYTK